VDRQRIREFERPSVFAEARCFVAEGQSRPASEGDVEPSALWLVSGDRSDLAVGEVLLLRAPLGTPSVSPLIAQLDDFVLRSDLLVAHRLFPIPSGAEATLEPPIEVVDTVSMHADRRENLKPLCAIGCVEGNPSLLGEAKGMIESCDVSWRCEAELGLELLLNAEAQILRRFPYDDLKVVEGFMKF
jgi:hypothetical protein